MRFALPAVVSFAIVTLTLAKGVVKWLRTGVFPADASVPAAYLPGETFPGRAV